MLQTQPYLNFPGNTEEAMKFYASALNGEITAMNRFKDMPGCGEVAAADQDKIVHAALSYGQGNQILATDALESFGQKLEYGNNTHLCLNTESQEEADKVFAGLSAGGKVSMPLNNTFWGAYFGMCVDKFGISWMIQYLPAAQN